MYQCLKIKKVVKQAVGGVSHGRVFYIITFLDMNEARTFPVYYSKSEVPPFDVGTTYELHFKPQYNGLNFLSDEK